MSTPSIHSTASGEGRAMGDCGMGPLRSKGGCWKLQTHTPEAASGLDFLVLMLLHGRQDYWECDRHRHGSQKHFHQLPVQKVVCHLYEYNTHAVSLGEELLVTWHGVLLHIRCVADTHAGMSQRSIMHRHRKLSRPHASHGYEF